MTLFASLLISGTTRAPLFWSNGMVARQIEPHHIPASPPLAHREPLSSHQAGSRHRMDPSRQLSRVSVQSPSLSPSLEQGSPPLGNAENFLCARTPMPHAERPKPSNNLVTVQ